jgi:DNA repair exonuclease SbcCD ATPase subunit
LAEARASAVIKQEEDLARHAHQVNQWARDVEELEGQLQEREGQLLEREELDDITLRRELEVLSTRETSLEHHEADLDRKRKALEDARAQILAHELDADSRETDLRNQEARLATRVQQVQELAVVQKGLEDLKAFQAGEAQHIWSFLS